jgi:hypothetical protein
MDVANITEKATIHGFTPRFGYASTQLPAQRAVLLTLRRREEMVGDEGHTRVWWADALVRRSTPACEGHGSSTMLEEKNQTSGIRLISTQIL